MNRFSFFTALLLTFFSCNYLQSQLTRHVLFLGDSYTYVNDLPLIITNIAASAGDNLIYDSNLPGGYKLVQHFADPASTSKIMAGGWDYVVLQEQSQTPALQNGNFSVGSQQLCRMVKQYNPCAQNLFYMTWGRKNGDALNCPLFPLMCTYKGMDSLTSVGYTLEASANNAEVSPVGAVWNYLRQNYPALELYQADESHPSLTGSYAAACCFYTAIFKKSPLLITSNYGLAAADAAVIRNAVKTVVFDHLPDWNFEVNPTTAQFNYTIGNGNNVANFNYLPTVPGLSPYSNHFVWEFGDGTTLNIFNPGYSLATHSYSANGTYTVKLTVSNCNMLGVHQATYQTTLSFCNHTPTVFSIHPWHCFGPDTISTQAYSAYQWYSEGNPIAGETNQRYTDGLSNLSVMTTQNGCSEMSANYFSNSDPVLFNYDVLAEGSFIDTNTFCNGTQARLIITALDGTENIQWLKNGQPLALATNDTLNINSPGNYAVKLFHYNCPDVIIYSQQRSFAFVACYTGIAGYASGGAELRMYPNPSSGAVTISSSTNIIAIELYNVLGERVDSKHYNHRQTTEELDLLEYAKGIYSVKVYDEAGFHSGKIIIQ